MALPTFPTLGIGPYGPVAPGSGRDAKPAVLTASFGDRYSQRTGDGINPLPRDFAYRSLALTAGQAATLDAFLAERKGYRPFLFTVPFEPKPRQFICPTWRLDQASPTLWTLTATFQENFDP